MGLKTVIHHQAPVSNLEAAVEWYVNVLGFELQKPISPGSTIALLSLPERGASVHLIQTTDQTRLGLPSEEKDNYVVGFYCERIRELQQKLIESGCAAMLEDAGGCGWWLYFADPDGNRYFAAEDKEPAKDAVS
ncbi:hypothetical protein J31TS4_22610 [Paenibacillus sp. J31TS4]|uniref:VOC family protein n=1 Tax=Paenibacillus sp. J31TS4 TaxID=2807195 RepID=UPI001B15DD59|nr:VOC family protein [Paenibacillus sp. J31TS4]GIP38981.1 hypothetical protein J31TS4_22610 [Paenibacillus sp. J31TS4]